MDKNVNDSITNDSTTTDSTTTDSITNDSITNDSITNDSITNDEDYDDFIEKINNIKNNNTNILTQLPKYNESDTDFFINKLLDELEQQKTINNLIKSKNVSKTIDNINKFTTKNKDLVKKQISDLTNVSEKIIDIINKNKELMENENNLTNLVTNGEYSLLAQDLNKLKEKKEKIKFFLKTNSIITQNLD